MGEKRLVGNAVGKSLGSSVLASASLVMSAWEIARRAAGQH